ncbi:hypothetical protein PGB90_002803 [Kerria lacca]
MINNNEKRGKAQTMENRMETVYIKDIHVGMKNLTLTCIVLEVGQPVALKENREVRTVKVADATACINLAVWDDTGHYINASDILRLTKVYATLWRNSLTLYTAKTGTVEKIGEFCMVFNDQLNMSDIVQTPPSNNPPNGNNTTNTNSSYVSRNNTLTANSHTVPPSHITSGSSRYDLSRNNSSRNGQQIDDSNAVNPRNRTERR